MSRRLRVGLLTYGMAGSLTGIGRYARSLTYAMARRDPDLEIVLLNPYPRSRLSWYGDFPVHHVPSLARLPGILALGSAVVARAAARLNLDIVHDPCGIAPFLWPRSRSRRVVTIHDAVPYVLPDAHALLTHLVFRSFIPAARYTSDAVLTVSESAARDLAAHARLPPAMIEVTYPGVDAPTDEELRELRSASLDDVVPGLHGSPMLLYVGADNPRKNLHLLLEAFPSVRAVVGDARLVLAGPLTRRDVPTGVHYLGHVSDEQLRVLYARAACVVYPSLYEGFGLPVLEGMAFGAPVITSSVSSMPEIAGDACLLIDPRKRAHLAEALTRVLTDEALGRGLRAAGRVRAQAFSWDRTADATLAVYRRLCPAGPSE